MKSHFGAKKVVLNFNVDILLYILNLPLFESKPPAPALPEQTMLHIYQGCIWHYKSHCMQFQLINVSGCESEVLSPRCKTITAMLKSIEHPEHAIKIT